MSGVMRTSTGVIKGKVAGILNERELTVNIGSKGGVLVGMKFVVLADKPIDVVDPETKVKLGEVDREKVRVSATEVQERFSVCQTYRKIRTGGYFAGGFGILPDLMAPAREVPETFKIKDASLPAPLSEEESIVKIGDRVVQVRGEDAK